MAWVTNDGEYNGGSEVLNFEFDDLTIEQWENLENMADSDRLPYVEAILANDEDAISFIEMNNFG